MGIVQIPYGFTPRSYQLPVLKFLDGGGKRAALVWHRRSGKDSTMMNFAIKKAVVNPGIYYHLFPTFTLGKRVLWDGRTRDGKKFLDYIPKEARDGKPNDSEMKVKFKNGSIYQVIGTDQFDSIIGTNPIGCIFSEYSVQNPKAWDLMRPILTENNGWAVFIFTPRGKNHAWKLFQTARADPERWFTQTLTVDDTRRDDGTPVITQEDIEQERRDGMDPELARQEFWCSWTAPMSGSYYGMLMDKAESEERICNVPWNPKYQVDTWWDLGIGDSTAIWFTQSVGREIRVIDYLETSGVGFDYYAKTLRERPYVYGRHGFPHDATAKELGTGVSIEEQAYSLGIRPIDIIPKLSIEDGISAVRILIPRCWFDRGKCEKGIDSLVNYHKEWDEDNRCWKQRPMHDFSSHGADSFRYLAIGIGENISGERQQIALTDFNPYTYNTDRRYLDQQEQAESEFNVFER